MLTKSKTQLLITSSIFTPIFVLLTLVFNFKTVDSTNAQLNETITNQSNVWVSVESPTTNDLYSVETVSATNGWAVGSGGTILYWNGNTWVLVNSSTTDSLNSIAMVSETDGWIVGSNGTILYWNGNSWTEVNSPTTDDLWSVTMVSATDGWAVGNNGVILRWDGNAWTTLPGPTTGQLFSVEMVSSVDGWIAGYENNHGIMLRWNGNEWSSETLPPVPRLFSVSMVSATDGWVVGENAWILHWNGSSWGVFHNEIVSEQGININRGPTWLNSVFAVAGDDVWAVGGFINSSAIFHWDGNTWTFVSNPATNWLQDITMVSSTDGWAVGYGGNIIRYVTPSLEINYVTGRPDSFFTITGANFPANSNVAVEVNGYSLTETLAVDSAGNLNFLLDSSMADPGRYFVTVTNPNLIVDFLLDTNAPLRPQEGSGPVFDVPSGIAYVEFIYLPFARR